MSGERAIRGRLPDGRFYTIVNRQKFVEPKFVRRTVGRSPLPDEKPQEERRLTIEEIEKKFFK